MRSRLKRSSSSLSTSRRARRVAGRERRRLAVDLDARQLLGGLVLERDLRGRAASAASRRAAAPAPRCRSPDPSARPRSPARASRAAARQRLVRAQAMSETATRSKISASARYGSGKSAHSVRVDDQPVDDVDELLELGCSPNGGSPAPAQEDGQVGQMSSGCDHARRRLSAIRRAGAARIISVHDPPPVPGVAALDLDARRRSRRRLVRLGEEHDRPRRVPLRQPGERVLRRLHPRLGHPGECASSRSSAGSAAARASASSALRGELALDLAEHRALSAVATSGRPGGAARPRPAGPSVPAA